MKNICVILVAMLVISGCGPPSVARYGSIGSVSYYSRWSKTFYSEELVHLIVVPDGVLVRQTGSSVSGASVPKKGIFSSPDGLFVDGVNVSEATRDKVFIYGHDRKSHAISLSQYQLSQINPRSIASLDRTEVWKDQISVNILSNREE